MSPNVEENLKQDYDNGCDSGKQEERWNQKHSVGCLVETGYNFLKKKFYRTNYYLNMQNTHLFQMDHSSFAGQCKSLLGIQTALVLSS
jgi:hypothetical protein